jgi:hypothetical protein
LIMKRCWARFSIWIRVRFYNSHAALLNHSNHINHLSIIIRH